MPQARDAALRHWLSGARDGYCAATSVGPSDCEHADKGSWPLAHPDMAFQWTWRPALLHCLARCQNCRRCSFVTVSVVDKDCSWYHECNLQNLHQDLGKGRFKSGRALHRMANLSLAQPPTTGSFTEAALVATTQELEQPDVRNALHAWRTHSRRGTCGVTQRLDEGDCVAGDSGCWELSACEARTWRTGLAHCLARCAACARCSFVSVKLGPEAECSWFSSCDAFDQMPAGDRAREAAGSSRSWRGLRSGPANGGAWSAILRAERLPHTFEMAIPRDRHTWRRDGAKAEGRNGRGAMLAAPSDPPRWQAAREAAATRPRACARDGWARPRETNRTAQGQPPSTGNGEAPPGAALLRIGCSHAAIEAAGAWLVVGVLSGVSSRLRRDAIRDTWFRWPAFATDAAGCFVLARRAALSDLIDPHEGASALGDDMVWLSQATEGCAGMSFSKTLEWWRWAAALPGSVTHVVKTEDDAVLVLPNVMATLAAWRSTPGLYLGGFAYAGYDLDRLTMCGFDWQGGGNFRRYGCRGFPAVPFAQGPLEALSMDLVRRIATSRAIARFVGHAARHGGGGGRCEEDVLLGVWIAHLQAKEPGLEVNYRAVDLNDLADLHCGGNRNQLMSTVPRREQLVVHRLKSAGGMAYVWDVLSCGIEHDRAVCNDRACKGEGANACAMDV